MNFETPENQFHVLLIGNNPNELSNYNSNLINDKQARYVTDVSFDLKESIKKVFQNNPGYILVDDCFGIEPLKRFIRKIRSKNKTQNIPVALLKSTNKSQLLISGIQDYFLKDNFSADRLYHAIKNSRKIRRTQIILYKTYKKSKRHYKGLLNRLENN